MLVLRFLWSYGFLIIFMAHPLSTAPTNGSLPITIKLKEEIATRYGKLLKALISVNEQRLDVLHKLHRLQDLPLGVLRTQEPEVYAVWKLDTDPTTLIKIKGLLTVHELNKISSKIINELENLQFLQKLMGFEIKTKVQDEAIVVNKKRIAQTAHDHIDSGEYWSSKELSKLDSRRKKDYGDKCNEKIGKACTKACKAAFKEAITGVRRK
ncbi:uncharacterized protein LOC128681224 isoform X3 [Plodia interpunctella]|uniref:uncharacterized protein LOC128681224 isoform X3 n=1 Tax=Plodia interpunctella TaxID=58824 RepID=UPI002367A7A2|nr:uncharacterized protein LOC128681224 isoform X3 [Plodia interpunctella]